MKKLCEPNIDDEKVYEEIANSKAYKNIHCKSCQSHNINCNTCIHGNRGMMLNIKKYVFTRYHYYIQNCKDLNAIQPKDELQKNEIEVLEESYRNSKTFREIKKQLLEGFSKAKIGKCPYCMISEPTTLDHYFPKSIYPEYTLFAPNLLPCCSSCNTKKSNNIFIGSGSSQKRSAIHFYYDDLPQTQFLKAKFSVVNKIPQISFYLDSNNDSEINEVIQNHFNTMNLFKRYEEQSNELLSTICEEIKNQTSFNECIKTLQIRAQAMQKTFGANYWQTCIYVAMIEDRNQLLDLFDMN